MIRNVRTLLLLCTITLAAHSIHAQQYKTYKEIINRFHSDWKIHPSSGVGESSTHGDALASPTDMNALGAKWYFEPIEGTPYVRLENGFEEMFLHAQYGVLEVGQIIPDWKGAQWSIEKIAGTNYVEIRNVYTNAYLHTENGSLELGTRKVGWHSAMWELKDLPFDKIEKRAKANGPNITFPQETAKTGVVFNMPNNCETGFEWRFEWEKITGAISYSVYVARDNAQKPLAEFQMARQNSFVFPFDPGAFIPDTNLTGWSVSVQAMMNNGFTAWSKRRYFTIAPCAKEDKAVVKTDIAKTAKTMYTLQIDYNGYGALNNTGTINEIYIRVLDANRSLLWDNSFKTFTTPVTPFTVTFEAASPVGSILVSTNGDDAFWIDKVTLKKEKTEVMHWGMIGGKGWCLSTDANDGKTAPVKDFITPADGCKTCFELLINGKYVACPVEVGK